MNLSFLFLSLPIVLIQIPWFIFLSIISLLGSSFLYHNHTSHFWGYYILLFDQLNIINTCILISFGSLSVSLDFMTIYILERFLYNNCISCCFVYFLSFLNMMDIHLSILFCFNLLLYCWVQGREFSELERYAWHFIQAIYILMALSKKYPFRSGFQMKKE